MVNDRQHCFRGGPRAIPSFGPAARGIRPIATSKPLCPPARNAASGRPHASWSAGLSVRPVVFAMTRIIEINDLDSLAGYRLLWNMLLRQTPGASFFHSLDWLETYWQHFGHDQRLRVLVVYAAGEPLGILPLVVRNEPMRLGSVRVLTYPLHDWGSFYGPIGPNPTATLIAGLGHVRPHRGRLGPARSALGRCRRDAGRTRRALAMKRLPAAAAVWAQKRADRTGRRLGRLPGSAASGSFAKTCAAPSGSWPSGAACLTCGCGRKAPPGETTIRAGTCTTPARRWPSAVGRAARPPAPRCRTRRSGRSCATPMPRQCAPARPT